jgi:transposase
MIDSWVEDGRKIPSLVMNYIRKIAVRAVEEKGYSPEAVVDILGFTRSCIYDWLRKYHKGGMVALETQTAPGAEPKVTEEMEIWLREIILETTPNVYGYDTCLWDCAILAELLHHEFGVWVSERTISRHLVKMELSYQKPHYRAVEQDPEEVRYFLEEKLPRIRHLAKNINAEIAFEDESAVGVSTRYGRTWGEQGKTPEVPATDQRGKYNVLSTVCAQGNRRYSTTEQNINSQGFIRFLKQLLQGRTRPLILLLDRASFHGSKVVRDYVRAHRTQIRIFFLPRHAPKYNPDEQVWDEIKVNRIGKQPVKNKPDLKKRLYSALASLQHKTKRIRSFFQLPDTKYRPGQCNPDIG